MKQYSLLREDLDNLIEVTQGPDKEEPMKRIESKVKAACTRQYNKDIVLPYSTGAVGAAKKRAAPVEESLLDEGEKSFDLMSEKSI